VSWLAHCAWLALTLSMQEPTPEPVAQGGDPAPQQKDPVGDVGQQPVRESQGPPPPPLAEATPVESAPAPAVEPARPAPPAVTWPLTIEGIEQHLRGIAAAHPGVAALEVVGKSAGGREILALRLGTRGDGQPAERPVLLLADHQGPTSAGPEAMLTLAWQVAEEFERDENVRMLFSRATLVLAPALDPDARAVGAVRAGVHFERNFPSGWQPESMRPGSGRTSLSQPESLAAARYLANLKGCAVLLGFVPPAPRGAPYAEAELPAADREVFAKLCAALELAGSQPLVPWFELGSPGGTLFDFAYQARGIYPLAFVLPAEDELAAGGMPAFTAEVSARVLRCLTLLPRVELEQEALERLASDTWQLDVRIQNVGIVPTSSALARHRDPLADVALRLDGAKLVATAKKPSSAAAWTDASFQARPSLSGGTLAGGEGRFLRLILEAGPGVEVRVTAASLWAGSDLLQLTLP
jgi:zinc carboxypeptidase